MKLYRETFNPDCMQKNASIFSIGNGQIGFRGTHEEDYFTETRGTYCSGVFNTPINSEVSELVNLPDVINIQLIINGELFTLNRYNVKHYSRTLDMDTGELMRKIIFTLDSGQEIEYVTKRIVNQVEKENIAISIEIRCLKGIADFVIETGIDATQTNHGMQHLIEEEVKVINVDAISGSYKTMNSNIAIRIVNKFSKPGSCYAKNRKIYGVFPFKLKEGERWKLEKQSYIISSLYSNDLNESVIETLKDKKSYQDVLQQSKSEWQKFWDLSRVKIVGKSSFDQLSIDYALFQIKNMTPLNNGLTSIGAKGLTGEGYKGHVFWDTEIFLLPFYIYTQPEIARSLLLYRYNHLRQAIEKAKQKGYQGALYPWESALSGKEETPLYAALNIHTGKREKVSSGDAEQHISADIAYSIIEYLNATDDLNFFDNYGRDILQKTAEFWISRADYKDNELGIFNVIGPDEYTEYVDNNAYTNYLAYYNVKSAMDKIQSLKNIPMYTQFLEKLYLPQPNEKLIIPQDDTFLSKPIINLEKYRSDAGSQSILLDYSRDEVINMQILKQADVVMLLYLLPNLFSEDISRKNLLYYENKTIHDSSLSKSIHAIVAARLGMIDWAKDLYNDACKIDLGDNPHSSDDGLHAASLGSIWLMIILGFAGISFDNKLTIHPKLPSDWESLSFPFTWKGRQLFIKLSKSEVRIINNSAEEIDISICGKNYLLQNEVSVSY